MYIHPLHERPKLISAIGRHTNYHRLQGVAKGATRKLASHPPLRRLLTGPAPPHPRHSRQGVLRRWHAEVLRQRRRGRQDALALRGTALSYPLSSPPPTLTAIRRAGSTSSRTSRTGWVRASSQSASPGPRRTSPPSPNCNLVLYAYIPYTFPHKHTPPTFLIICVHMLPIVQSGAPDYSTTTQY
jgi:hypothetical protein